MPFCAPPTDRTEGNVPIQNEYRSSSGEQQNYWLTIRFIAPIDRSVVSGSAASTPIVTPIVRLTRSPRRRPGVPGSLAGW
jgi:hypothetical protein